MIIILIWSALVKDNTHNHQKKFETEVTLNFVYQSLPNKRQKKETSTKIRVTTTIIYRTISWLLPLILEVDSIPTLRYLFLIIA